jgi:hypothetical protein
MTEEVQTPQAQQELSNQPVLYPIALTAQEVQGIVGVLKKLPMEQVEGLVGNIINQFNNIQASLQPKE